MRDWLDHLLYAARVVELRHQDGDRMYSGLFDDIGALRTAIRTRGDLGNLYTTLNRPCANVRATNAMGSAALADGDMALRTFLPFDFDPVRPRGMPSTDAELLEATHCARALMSRLLALDWPAPAMARSGNGAHLVYRLHLPADDGTAEMLATLYRGLYAEFSTDSVEFDRTVRNASRIWRLYGSTNRKGTPTPDRPHRTAQVTIPGRWRAVSPRAIDRLANHYARTAEAVPREPAAGPRLAVDGLGDYRTLDIVEWLAAHGLYRRPLGQGKHAIVCPWEHEHSSESWPGDSSTVCWETTGTNWPSFHCSHAHCEGRTVRELLEHLGDADAFCTRTWGNAS